MRDIPHQGQGGGQAEGLEDIPDGLGEPQWMGAVRNEHSPHEGEGSPGNAQWAAGGAEMGNKPGGEGILKFLDSTPLPHPAPCGPPGASNTRPPSEVGPGWGGAKHLMDSRGG